MSIHDERVCHLGEGAFWHPERQQFFWFDILAGRLMSRDGDRPLHWDLGEFASAAGWLDRETLLVATETGLWRLPLTSGDKELLVPLAVNRPDLRSNDGRADPWGGFWIGLMGKRAEKGAGGIWRYYRGELREVAPGITIPNAICFDAGRERAYFADTAQARIWTQRLSPADGWPVGEPELFLDLSSRGLNPDGAVTDDQGRLWNAQWGAGRVAIYSPDGQEVGEELFDATQLSCPAFGGADLQLLHVTSAHEGMDDGQRGNDPHAGKTFVRRVDARGVAEPRVVL